MTCSLGTFTRPNASSHPPQRVTMRLSPAVSPILRRYPFLSSSVIPPNWIGYMQHVNLGSSSARTPMDLSINDAAYST